MSHIRVPVVGDRQWMDQWRYWKVLGGHFASSAREDQNLAFGAKHSRPTLELCTSTIFTDEYTFPVHLVKEVLSVM